MYFFYEKKYFKINSNKVNDDRKFCKLNSMITYIS